MDKLISIYFIGFMVLGMISTMYASGPQDTHGGAEKNLKKATFAGELSRQTRVRYGKSLSDIISDGQFNKIEGDLFERAVEKSFELVYQQTPKGNGIFSKAARGYLDADKRAGFILGALIPFPRFVINQIKFMYEHAPVIGMLNATKDTMPKKIGQQLTGLSLIMGGMAIRAQEGTDMEWYEINNEQGQKIDLRPLLGPFNMFMYLGDIAYRKITGQEYKDDYMAEIRICRIHPIPSDSFICNSCLSQSSYTSWRSYWCCSCC